MFLSYLCQPVRCLTDGRCESITLLAPKAFDFCFYSVVIGSDNHTIEAQFHFLYLLVNSLNQCFAPAIFAMRFSWETAALLVTSGNDGSNLAL